LTLLYIFYIYFKPEHFSHFYTKKRAKVLLFFDITKYFC